MLFYAVLPRRVQQEVADCESNGSKTCDGPRGSSRPKPLFRPEWKATVQGEDLIAWWGLMIRRGLDVEHVWDRRPGPSCHRHPTHRRCHRHNFFLSSATPPEPPGWSEWYGSAYSRMTYPPPTALFLSIAQSSARIFFLCQLKLAEPSHKLPVQQGTSLQGYLALGDGSCDLPLGRGALRFFGNTLYVWVPSILRSYCKYPSPVRVFH